MSFKIWFVGLVGFLILAIQPVQAFASKADSKGSLANSSQAASASSLSIPISFSSSISGSGSDGSSNASSQSSAQSINASYAISNASLLIPGRPAPKVPGNAVAVSSAVEDAVRIKKGWIVSYVYKIFDDSKPTLLLLPGIFRGLEKEEEALRTLEASKVNFVAIHFSTHNKSILWLEENETPYFDGGLPHFTPEKFAREVEAVAHQLELQKPIIVSLSYSAVVVPYLDSTQFPYVVQVAPMGRHDESNLIGGAVQKNWEDWLALNPYIGREGVLVAKNYYLHMIWNPVVLFLASQMPSLQDSTIFTHQVDGFVSMNFAAEPFDISQTNFRKTGKKFAWVVAESEDPTRAYFQAAAIKKYLASLDQATYEKSIFGKQGVYIIKGSSHLIPQDQPALYAGALSEVVKRADKEKVFGP
jgi:pimeloyl-ACP methyl ester carboxylesterase